MNQMQINYFSNELQRKIKTQDELYLLSSDPSLTVSSKCSNTPGGMLFAAPIETTNKIKNAKMDPIFFTA